MPAKKQKTSPGDGVKRTQQTLSESLKSHKQRKDHEVEINSGRIEVQTMQANYLLLEDKYVTTSTSSVDQYKRESRLCQSTLGRNLPRNLTTRRSLRKQSSFEGLCIDEEEDRGTLGSSGRWEEHGLAFLDVLAMHLSKTTALPIKYQELLLHMVLNADSHREVFNLSSRALELLMVNANLHPGSQQDMKHPHILHCNRDLWRPENKFEFESVCYAALCPQSGTSCPKLSVFIALLRGAKRLVSEQQGKGSASSTQDKNAPSSGPGPLGCTLALQYVCHLLQQDFHTRMKVYVECSHQRPVDDGGLKGDLNAGKILGTSSLAMLLSGYGNSTSSGPGWTDMVAEVIYILADLIAANHALGVTPPTKARAVADVDLIEEDVIPTIASMAAVAAADVPTLARQLLGSMYDLFMVMEEEQKLFGKDWKDTDCRMLAMTLHKLLVKTKVRGKEAPPEVQSKFLEPASKATLLSSLSARARAHLLTFIYAKAASKRWQGMAGEAIIRPEQMLLQPSIDYAEGKTSVRMISEGELLRMNPEDVLQDLDIEDNFTHGYQQLLSSAACNGEGFVLWLCEFTLASVASLNQVHKDYRLPLLKDAFKKVEDRVKAKVMSKNGYQLTKLEMWSLGLANRVLGL